MLGFSGHIERIKGEGWKVQKKEFDTQSFSLPTCKGNGQLSLSYVLLDISIWPYAVQNHWIPMFIPWSICLTRLPRNIQTTHGRRTTSSHHRCKMYRDVHSHIAQYFHRAGLPIWFIQPWKTGPFPYNVLTVVSPLDPTDSLCVSPHDPPFPVIFRGYMTAQVKHNAIHCYSWKWLVFKDPFHDEPPSKDPEPRRHVALGASCEPISCLSQYFFFLLKCIQAPNNSSCWSQQIFTFKQLSLPILNPGLECCTTGC